MKNNKVKLTEAERNLLKYEAVNAEYEYLMHFINSGIYRKVFGPFLSFLRKAKGLDMRDIIISKEMKKEIKNRKKPKIALIIDKEDWAFANIATQIIKNLDEYYEFLVIPTETVEKIDQIILLVQDCDLVHFFWRGMIYQFLELHTLVGTMHLWGMNYKTFMDQCVKPLNISTCVYDHMYLREDDIERTKEIVKLTDNYYVSSQILSDIYEDLDIEKKPNCVITDGVDLEKFYQINKTKFKDIKNRKVKIGWVGNSKWGEHDKKFNDVKGVNTILKPALQELIKEGYNIEMYFADRNEIMIPHDEMVNYYNDIDIYICTSEIEGTPNPVLESMACGVPVITTRVGVVTELLGKKQQKYILEERTVECLKEKVKLMISDLDNLEGLSKENLKSIKDWSWKKKCDDFKVYFDKCLKKKK